MYNSTTASTNVLPDGQRGTCVFNKLYFNDSLNCYIEVFTSPFLRNILITPLVERGLLFRTT